MTKAYRAYAPASAANLSVGFDLLGAALKPINNAPLGDFVTVRPSMHEGCTVICSGRYAHKLPSDPKKNIVYDAYLLYREELRKHGKAVLNLELELQKNLPVCSGLGSSAASVVAAVVALDAVHDHALGEEGKIKLMGALEGKISGSIHYDNVAPCYFGGLQLIIGECGIISERLPSFPQWYWVSCFPGIKVSTAAARSILPAQYRRQDVITYGRHLASFVHACHCGNDKLAAACLTDVIAEPYRAQLIPGFDLARQYGAALQAIATGISGSGSSIFSIFTSLEAAQEMKEWLERNFIDNEDGFCHICTIDEQGARVETIEE
ncbi:MAG: homoserine kinase [Candidatus Anaerobiospirillum merdipullorum]|uniref:Homoserine kinase n=1 Tax=Candidatus Anaerobiospirillum merdipullorum TaxID=2838450 RepID=A0A9E2NRD3_9GAMM|nr:homoserine kinase [Candidatus Anaerobiospirillum merdipullorum]